MNENLTQNIATRTSMERHFEMIRSAPIVSFERRRTYDSWKKNEPELQSHNKCAKECSDDSKHSLPEFFRREQVNTLSNSIYSANIYKYLYSCGSLISLFGGVFSIIQSRRNKWLLYATPPLLANSYFSYAKFEETIDDIKYLTKRKEMREQCE
ncbi:hypothetical protein XU18_1978 [Perkinsela sp. CCAP 1560/4]|nr:hypothetical protein XU18_1978 [Perkinsela sp. CCAP 1560/4]|eukprot:KNH07446.1 hypothetical protein XU18_1978 [Perkinsela sp. CCAP 1560/4]